MEEPFCSARSKTASNWPLIEPSVGQLVPSARDMAYLDSLRDFVRVSESAFSEVRSTVALLAGEVAGNVEVRQIAMRLGQFCADADSWGFDNLLPIASKIHLLVLDLYFGVRTWSEPVAQAIERSVSLLSSLVCDCEITSRHALEITDVLNELSQF